MCVYFVNFNITNVMSNIRTIFSCIQDWIRDVNLFTFEFNIETDGFAMLCFL